MLVMFLLMDILFNMLGYIISPLLYALLIPMAYEIAYQLIYGLFYVLSFMLPVIVFKVIFPKHEYYPIPASPRLPKHTAKYTVVCIGLVFGAAFMNSLIMQIFYTAFGMYPDMSPFAVEITGVHSCILLFITSALIPGFVEEFLFRGVFMRNLLPYGKTAAVVVSALLFALMHQNFLQFFYTFIAGLVLGYLFLKTGSIWCGVIVHTLNNFVSVIEEILAHYMNDDAYNIASYLIMIVIELAAFICLLVLLGKHKKQDQLRKGSVFGHTEVVAVPSGSMEVTDREAVKGFLSPITYAVASISVLYAIDLLTRILVPM